MPPPTGGGHIRTVSVRGTGTDRCVACRLLPGATRRHQRAVNGRRGGQVLTSPGRCRGSSFRVVWIPVAETTGVGSGLARLRRSGGIDELAARLGLVVVLAEERVVLELVLVLRRILGPEQEGIGAIAAVAATLGALEEG